jgi:hypothetical protein
MERFRIEWHQGPTVVAREAWVIDLDLMVSTGRAPYLLAKRLQVVAPVDELAALGVTDPGWDFWRALVAIAVRIVIRKVAADELHFDTPRIAFQMAPDLAEALRRSADMPDEAVAVADLVQAFAD